MIGASLLAAFWGTSASAQTEPIQGYYELQVAYCWGMYSGMIPMNNQTKAYACSKAYQQTATYNCQIATTENATWQDQTNELRDYLFTGTADHGANSSVMIAVAHGTQFASDLSSGNQALPLAEIKDRSDECRSVIKELPY